MALTAAIRSLVIGLIATGLTWLTTKLAVELDIAVISELVGNAIFVVGSGLVAYAVNKLGSRWSWINLILSAGTAKSSSVYIPTNQEEVTAITTPPGERTIVTATNSVGATSPVTV